jgi:hypothetical protein
MTPQDLSMAGKRFHLIATVSTDNPAAVRPVLKELIGKHGGIEEVPGTGSAHGGRGEFRVQADLDGMSAKELNRSLLSALRKAEKRTRLRAAWSCRGTVEQYFDYVLKKTTNQSASE